MKLNIAWLRRKIREIEASILGPVNKLGIQCQEKGEAAYRYNRKVRPNSIKAINIVDTDFWQRIWAENPRLQYAIYRECPNGPGPWDDPEGKAIAWVDHLKSKIGHLVEAGLITHIEGYNEWVHSFQKEQFPAADRFMAALIEETHRQFDDRVHIIVLNASCGHFSSDILIFPETLTILNECPKCMLGMHEYDRDNMDRTQPWRCGKFQLVEQALDEAGYQNVSLAITELGLDDCVERPVGSPHRGWRYYGAIVEEAIAHFLDDHNLAWYYPLLMTSDRVKLASIFGCQMFYGNNWGEWGFDIRYGFPMLLDGIRNLEISPPEPPPEPEEPMKIRVVDLEYEERDLAYAKAKYGVAFRRAKVAPGQKVYRLIELWEKTGHSSLVTQVLNEDGQPMADVNVAFYWTDAPEIPPSEIYPMQHDWHRNFVHGLTNIKGDVGPGMGPGAYHGEGEGGPHAVWVRDPDIPSDICEKLGMLAGTNHDHLDQKFKLMVEGEGPGPEPPSPPSKGEWEEIEGGRAFQPQGNNRIVVVAQGERDFYDTRAWIGVAGSDWEAGPFHPESLTKYVLTTDYTPGESEESRIFWVTICQPDGMLLSLPYRFEFHTGEHGWWTTLVEWRGPAPEPPPSGDLAAKVDAMLEAIADASRERAIIDALLAAEMKRLMGD